MLHIQELRDLISASFASFFCG